MNKARVLRGVSWALAVTALLGACGDDDDSGAADDAPADAGGDTTDTTAAFTGEPVTVGLIVPTETAGANFPEVIAAVEAAAMAINERGGIAGHEVEIAYCNEGDDPNQAAECAQQMVDEGVIATVSSFSRSGGQNIYDVLEPAGIAQVAPVTISAVDFTNPVAFPVDAALLNFIGCGALFAPAAELGSIGAIQFDVDASTQTITLAQLGASSVDVPFTTSVRVPPTATDFAPAVGDVAGSGAEGVVLSLPEQQSVQVIQTANQLGDELAFCHADTGLSPDSLSQLGDAADRVFVVGSFPTLSQRDEIPELQRMFDELAAAGEAGVDDTGEELVKGSTLRAWIGMQVIEQIGNGVTGDLTAESFLDALNAGTASVDGLVDIDFAEKSNIPNPTGDPLTQVFNGNVRIAQWDGPAGVFVPVEGVEPIDGLDVLAAILGG